MRFLLALTLTFLPVYAADLEITALTCEHRINPTGLSSASPRLSWRFKTSKRGKTQRAYQILAASSPAQLAKDVGDLWDTGKKKSLNSYLLYYKGEKPLQSSQQVFWKVKVWDENDQASPWSEGANFTMGLLDAAEWKAEWISHQDQSLLHRVPAKLHLPSPRYYRKSFSEDKKIVRALVHATALGVYELQLNGSKVGDAYLAPGWSDYSRRTFYNSYDVTSQVVSGENCLGAIVADGWYAGYLGFGKRKGYGPFKTGRSIYGKTPALLVQLHLEFEDGSSKVITTDPSWVVTTGPEYEADLLLGEAYDANKELTGWSSRGYDDAEWKPAVLASSNKNEKATFSDKSGTKSVEVGFTEPKFLQGYSAAPVRVIEELPTKLVTQSSPGAYLFDFGQNFTGNVRLKVTGMKGQKITLRYGIEASDLKAQGKRDANATDTYICKGLAGGETWTPRFTLHTFRYAEISGYHKEPDPDVLTGLVIHSDLPLTSGFECSNERVNRIYQNCVWTQRANWVELPTSSERPNERMGNTGAAQVYAKAACFHSDNAAFYRKWFGELSGARDGKGHYAPYAPSPFADDRLAYGSAWSDAGIICTFAHWWMYGDEEVIKEQWVPMKKYLQARRDAHDKGRGRVFGTGWGDQLNYNDPTPAAFIDLCFLALDYRLMGEMSRIAGNPIDHLTMTRNFTEIQEQFRKKYVNADGSLKVKSQTAHVLALRFGLLTEKSKEKIKQELPALLKAKEDAKMSGMNTGFLGTKALFPVLTWTGNHDHALKLLQTQKYPSWGFAVENGATSLWSSFGPRGKTRTSLDASVDHRFGAVSEWLMAMVAGIDAVFPGFQRIRLEPWIAEPGEGQSADKLTWVRAHYDSCRGRISVHWKVQADGTLLYECTIPVQTTATVRLPAREGAKVLIDGKAPDEKRRFEGGFVLQNAKDQAEKRITLNLLQSGSYRIEVK